ncbi:MAG TPA: hypothetical protein VHF88_07695 [Thermoleophilaceae bacterium]|nr:hypothetical protein [Thermoleophilaceae bacterium]
MTPTATIPSADKLHTRLTECEQAVADLEQEIGVAELEGKPSPSGASGRLRKARDELERVQAAIRALEDREASEADRQAMLAAARTRLGEYRWAVERYRLSEDAIRAHDAAAETINRLADLGMPGRVSEMFQTLGIRYAPGMKCEPYEGRRVFRDRQDELDVEAGVLRPAARKRFSRPKMGESNPYFPFGWLPGRGPLLTIERCQELRHEAERLAAEQEAEIERLETQGAAA